MQKFDEWGMPIHEVPQYEEYKPQKEKFDLFKIMYSALDKKMNPSEEQKSKISAFLFDNILANNENTLELALLFTTHNIPVNKQYDMVRTLLPKCYIPYPKKKKNIQEDVDNIIRYYECNEIIALQYHKLMSDKEIQRINNLYKEGIKGN